MAAPFGFSELVLSLLRNFMLKKRIPLHVLKKRFPYDEDSDSQSLVKKQIGIPDFFF